MEYNPVSSYAEFVSGNSSSDRCMCELLVDEINSGLGENSQVQAVVSEPKPNRFSIVFGDSDGNSVDEPPEVRRILEETDRELFECEYASARYDEAWLDPPEARLPLDVLYPPEYDCSWIERLGKKAGVPLMAFAEPPEEKTVTVYTECPPEVLIWESKITNRIEEDFLSFFEVFKKGYKLGQEAWTLETGYELGKSEAQLRVKLDELEAVKADIRSLAAELNAIKAKVQEMKRNPRLSQLAASVRSLLFSIRELLQNKPA